MRSHVSLSLSRPIRDGWPAFLVLAGVLSLLLLASFWLRLPFHLAAAGAGVAALGLGLAFYATRKPQLFLFLAMAFMYVPQTTVGPMTLFQYASLLGIFGAALDLMIRHRAPRLTVLFPPYVLFTGLIVLSLTYALDIPFVQMYLYLWVRDLALVLLIVNYLTDRSRLRVPFRIFLTLAAASALWAIVESRVMGGGLYRPVALVGDPNRLSGLIILGLPVALSLAVDPRRLRTRLVGMGLSLLLIMGIVTTASRGGVAAAAVTFVVFAALNLRRWPFFVTIVAVLLALSPLIPDVFWHRFSGFGVQLVQTVDVEQVQLTDRGQLNRAAISMWRENPILGVGAGQFYHNYGFAQYNPGAFRTGYTVVAHNMYLQALAENGPIGLLLLLTMLASAGFSVLRARRRARERGDEEMRRLATVQACILVGVMTVGATLNFLYAKELHMMLGLSMALAAVDLKSTDEGKAEPPDSA